MGINALGPLVSQRLDYYPLVRKQKRIVTRADHPVVGDWGWFGFPDGVVLTPGACRFGFCHVYKQWGSKPFEGDGHYVRWMDDKLFVDGILIDTGRSCWFTLTNVFLGLVGCFESWVWFFGVLFACPVFVGVLGGSVGVAGVA